MNKNQIAALLRKLSEQIAVVANNVEQMRDKEPVFPAWAETKRQDRICLECGQHIDQTETPDRGRHQKCMRPIRSLLKTGQLDEFKLIEEGLLAPAERTGRPRKDQNQQIIDKALEVSSPPPQKAKRPKKSEA